MNLLRAFCCLLAVFGVVSSATAAEVLLVSNDLANDFMVRALEGAGHRVTLRSNALHSGRVLALEADLSAYDAVYWDASRPSGAYAVELTSALDAYVQSGGALFVTGAGALSGDAGVSLRTVIGGSPGGSAESAEVVLSEVTSFVTTGFRDTRGLRSTAVGIPQDTLVDLRVDTRAVATSAGRAVWTERARGRGVVVWVAHGEERVPSWWEEDAEDGAGVYHAALLNFVANAETLGRERRVLVACDGVGNTAMAEALQLDGHAVTTVASAVDLVTGRVAVIEDELEDYEVLVWSMDSGFLLREYAAETLAAVREFLNQGGRVLLVGSNLAATSTRPREGVLELIGCTGAEVSAAELAPVLGGSAFSEGLFDLVGATPTKFGQGRVALTGCSGDVVAHEVGLRARAQWLSVDLGGGLGVLSNSDAGAEGAGLWLADPKTSDGASSAALRNFVWNGKLFDFDGDGFTLDDINPLDGTVYPGAPELCDGIDNDGDPRTLDGSGDERITLALPCDGDDTDLCEEGVYIGCVAGRLICSDDTDDTLDLCDGIDNDCNPDTPDGFGEPGFGMPCDGPDSDACEEGIFVCDGIALRCSDDTDDSIEICDGIDNDCDGAVDDEDTDISEGSAQPIGGFTFYPDADGDGCGLGSAPLYTCGEAPPGYVANGFDLDDTDGHCCGNGVTTGGETCDDGNNVSGDGCDASCQREAGWACDDAREVPSWCAKTCGDGVIDVNEACDDANLDWGDGCTPSCVVEEGWACESGDTGASECTEVCGDGWSVGAERCDDGNTRAGDGCDEACQPEPGYVCVVSERVSTCADTCGNGTLDEGEACDDGNLEEGDGCTANCEIELGWSCSNSGCATVCGDGLVRGAEECDDGNNRAGDGCEACRVSAHWICADEPSTCSALAYCGDGTVDDGEACDDGNNRAGDGCDAGCSVEPGWICDNGDPTTCLEDRDQDGILDVEDNCPEVANADQADLDDDGVGDVCDDDMDGDGVPNSADACPREAGDAPDGCPTSGEAERDAGVGPGLEEGESVDSGVSGGSGCSSTRGRSFPAWCALLVLGAVVRRRGPAQWSGAEARRRGARGLSD